MAAGGRWPVVVAKFWMKLDGSQRGMVFFSYGIRSFGRAVQGRANQADMQAINHWSVAAIGWMLPLLCGH